jgi:UDP-N-acetylglucosamine 2-epimerase (non-hydrolysing)
MDAVMRAKVVNRIELTEKIAVLVGTRPGIIKFSPVIRDLVRRQADFFIIHTGQHYSENMDGNFFEDLELPKPAYHNPRVKAFYSHSGQTAEMMKGVEEALLVERPAVVIVGGDANTNLAGALATRKLVYIKLAHMEAGLRSNDWLMPEEHNRVMIDHISDILFPPTEQAKRNLIKENCKGTIHVVGNPIVDSVLQNIDLARKKSKILENQGLPHGKYFLLTTHREENVENLERLTNIVATIKAMDDKYGSSVVFPIHPRTSKRLADFGLETSLTSIPGLVLIPPVGYLDFLNLLANCRLVLTDSGGIQEESCIIGVPCVTLRENTERPETLVAGSNIIGGTDPSRVLNAVDKMLLLPSNDWPNPFGDGKSSVRIVDVLIKEAGQNE